MAFPFSGGFCLLLWSSECMSVFAECFGYFACVYSCFSQCRLLIPFWVKLGNHRSSPCSSLLSRPCPVDFGPFQSPAKHPWNNSCNCNCNLVENNSSSNSQCNCDWCIFHGKQMHMQKVARSGISYVIVFVTCQENNHKTFFMYLMFLCTTVLSPVMLQRAT